MSTADAPPAIQQVSRLGPVHRPIHPDSCCIAVRLGMVRGWRTSLPSLDGRGPARDVGIGSRRGGDLRGPAPFLAGPGDATVAAEEGGCRDVRSA